jgi:hypothetical protein
MEMKNYATAYNVSSDGVVRMIRSLEIPIGVDPNIFVDSIINNIRQDSQWNTLMEWYVVMERKMLPPLKDR